MWSPSKEIQIENFFIFNSNLGPNEGEELKKIIYYFPSTDNTNVQIQNLGLVEGIIKFTKTFNPSSPVSSLHTNKLRQLYYEVELDYWFVMTLSLPIATKIKENTTSTEYLEEDLQDNVYEAALKQIYYMYRLFWGSLISCYEKLGIDELKLQLNGFYDAYLRLLKIENMDILTIARGIQYLPLDRQNFLKIQCLINAIESKWSFISYSAFLYNEQVVWSGLEPSSMQIVYQYLVESLLPANVDIELKGGSIPRNSPSPFNALRHGRFITGPSNLKQAKTVGKIPKVFLFQSEGVKEYYLLVYRCLRITLCLFIDGNLELSLNDFKVLDEFMNPKLSLIVNDIDDYCSKSATTQSNASDTSPKYIYFNKLNLAYISTVHLDNKKTGNLTCSKESVRIMSDMNETSPYLGVTGENIVKTMSDYWVFGKTSNLREFYVILQQKNASFNDVNEELKRLCQTELNGIFFHPM